MRARAAVRAGLLLMAVTALAACGGGEAGDPLAATSSPSTDGANALNMRLLGRLDLPTMTGSVGAACHLECEHVYTEGTPAGAGEWGYTARGGRRFALTGTSFGLSVDEVTESTPPRHVALIPGPESRWREIRTYRQVAYVTTEANYGLDIVDLSNPDRPAKVQTWSKTFTSAHTLCIDEVRGLLFANGTADASRNMTGMRVLSLQDPLQPREVGSFGSFYVHDCVVRGNTLYASAIYDGFLAVLDVSDPSNIREVTRFFTSQHWTHNSWPTPDGRYLFTTEERPGAPLEGWDIRDVLHPVKVSEYIGKAGTTPHNVLIDGTRLLVAHYTEGVHLLDISSPAEPRVLGHYDTFTTETPGVVFDGVWGAYIFPHSNLIVASDITNGLFVLSYAGG
jgi:choice-of-anchor B domain-containing protein